MYMTDADIKELYNKESHERTSNILSFVSIRKLNIKRNDKMQNHIKKELEFYANEKGQIVRRKNEK